MIIAEILDKGGPLMPLILAASGIGLLLTVERLLVWGWWATHDRAFYRAYERAALVSLIAERAARSKPSLLHKQSPLEWVLTQAHGLGIDADLPAEKMHQREKALESQVLACIPQVETRISTIGWLGGILPMLGLLGTVSGMITTFGDLAETTSRQVLSQGLSEALWTTEVGLLGALPLLAANHLLTRLKSRWLTQLERILALLSVQDAPLPAKGGTHES